MESIRRRLVGVALSLLACQLAATAAAPAMLWQARATVGAGGSDALCECKDEPGAACPMHKGKHQSPDDRSGASRWCAGRGNQATAILTLPTSNGGAPLQHSSPVVRPAQRGVALAAPITLILNADRPPTAPPPRG